jgi:hypothetical protein
MIFDFLLVTGSIGHGGFTMKNESLTERYEREATTFDQQADSQEALAPKLAGRAQQDFEMCEARYSRAQAGTLRSLAALYS